MSERALVASCHCGRAKLTLPRAPDQVTHCNCSLCTKTGFLGVYFPSEELQIEGEFDVYIRSDSNPACIAQQRCRHCGILTHWVPLTDPPHVRMGVNARLIEPEALEGVPVVEVDGRGWPA